MTENHNVKYICTEHLIDIQYKNEEKMLKELREGNFTYDKPLIKYNPYIVNALSAVMLFNTEEEIAFTMVIKGKEEDGDIIHTFPKAKEHVLPIVGLYNDYENKIEIWPYQHPNKKVTHTIKIDDIDPDKNIISMDTTKEYLKDQVIFSCPATSDLSIATDYRGDLRIKFDRALIWDIKQTKDGHFWMSSDRLIQMPYVLSGIYEFDLVGKIYKEYRIPNGYHHDQIFMDNGDLMVLSGDFEDHTVEDRLYVIDRETGEVKKTINYKEFMEAGANKSGSWSDKDWCHNNSLWYDKYTNSILISARHMNAIFNIDYDSHKLNWILGDPECWPEKYQKYFFKPKEGQKDFGWQYEQHSVFLTPNGDVGCFDNHHFGSNNPEKYISAKENYSRGVIYRIDTEKMEIEQTYQYGKERGSEWFSPYICNMVYYGENHYLMHSGGIAFDKDNNPSDLLGAFVQSQNNGGYLYSNTVIMNHGKKELELKTKSNYYRAEKISLYKEGSNNLTLGKGEILGKNAKTIENDVLIPAVEVDEELDAKREARIEEQFDMITFYAKFEKGQLAALVLENDDEEHQYFISTSAPNIRGAMCAGTFLTDDDRDTRTVVMKEGLKGEYKVKVIIDDKKFDTGIIIKA